MALAAQGQLTSSAERANPQVSAIVLVHLHRLVVNEQGEARAMPLTRS